MLKKNVASFRYAFHGIALLVKTQANARFHLLAAAGVMGAGLYLKVSALEWAILALTIGSVLAAEGFNTALEFLTDLVSPDYHELAGKTKDVAAGAVLITSFAAIGVGILIFGPKIAAIIL
ncbi:MAG TPA: diacylglycerol kinase family protein [Haliscomenobacter sp.]|uniref:diacylglycerol kinase family protein n=1 Tax=Haliscomenobacter sp. TaxID=2717303 RepID=UPI002CD7031D|nr:diacylglycerol kinase family protein [Haliscomenobacter sp.]HOY18785.1 diacylglycerol kinase family protein [Haliscomenobacter sp.]HPH17815.1 diacylglycerol kinase family protein [Haliscomenobacter sp.]